MRGNDIADETSLVGDSLWTTDLINDRTSTAVGGFLWSYLLCGALPSLVFVLYISLRFEYFTFGYLVSIGFLVLFLMVAPYIVWYYDSVLLPTFFEEVSAIVESRRRLQEISDTYQGRFATWWWIPCLLTLPTIPVLLFGGRSFVRSHGLFGLGDPLFWLVSVALLWIAVFVAIGMVMVVVTMGIVRAIAGEDLVIDPLHNDGLGGVSTVGHLAIRTTIMLSLGSLLLPLQFQYAIASKPLVTGVIYFNGVLYVAGIVASFVYPTLVINRRANELREETLEELRNQYRVLKERSNEPRFGASLESTDRDLELKLQRVRTEYRDFREVKLYPMETSILVRLIGSVLLPMVFIIVDTLLRPDILTELLSWLP